MPREAGADAGPAHWPQILVQSRPGSDRHHGPTMPADFFRRIDESDDPLFYSFPRFVVHIDDWAIKTIGEIFAERLPSGGTLLDLMSSWRSHLPPALQAGRSYGTRA